MISLKALGIEFRVHVLTLLAAVLALVLGIRTELPLLAMAVFIHEAAHLMTASLAGLCVESVELMWFGGAARIRDIYSARPLSIILTAVAGPFANLMTAVTTAAFALWDVLDFAAAAAMIRINLMLMLFNLMPALPLDGGRIFYALVSIKTGRRTAVRLGTALAHLLSVLLLAFTVHGWLERRVFNLTYVLMAVFLLSASLKELHAYKASGIQRALNAFCSEKPLPAKAGLVAIRADDAAEAAAAFIDPNGQTIFALIENDGIAGFLTESEMIKRILNDDVQCER